MDSIWNVPGTVKYWLITNNCNVWQPAVAKHCPITFCFSPPPTKIPPLPPWPLPLANARTGQARGTYCRTPRMRVTAATSPPSTRANPPPRHHRRLAQTRRHHRQRARNATSQPTTSAHRRQHPLHDTSQPPMPRHRPRQSQTPRHSRHVSVDERTVPRQNGRPSPPRGMWAPKSTGGSEGEPGESQEAGE